MLEKQKESPETIRIITTREEIQHSTLSSLTPVRSQDECCPRVQFVQDSQQ